MTADRRSSQTKRVAVVTGTRAEYGLLRSTMEAIEAQASLQLQVVVTGMHLLRKFGHTVDDIRRDGWRVDARVKMQAGDDSPLDQADGLARGVRAMARCFEELGTHVVLVLGDRLEAMAAALAALTTGRAVAHVHGGDVAPGDFDDRFRHAITKLAHVHFAATRSAARRLVRMGEASQRVHVVGAPGLDRLRELVRTHAPTKSDTRRALIVYHPCGRAASVERRVMTAILDVASAHALDRTIVYPNSDRGHQGVIEAIDAHVDRRGTRSVHVVRSLSRDEYLRTLIDSDVIIGNSSSGIIEACFAGTPAVNVGSRQRGREKGGRAVIDAGEGKNDISVALEKALRCRPTIGRPGPFGAAMTGPRIARVLARLRLNAPFMQKAISY